MADADDRAIVNLALNRYRQKCGGCGGSGYVLKYVRPRVVGLVQCVVCRGTGRRGYLSDDAAASKEYRQQFGVRTNIQIQRAERKRLKREGTKKGSS